MELRERVVLNLWRFRDRATGAEIEAAAEMVIATVLDALQEPSGEVVKAGEDASWDAGNCMPVPSYTKAAWLGMLATFRTEALGESQDRDTLTP